MQETDKKNRMTKLVRILNEASKAYYQESRELMSNLEYDALYDELVELEEQTGITLSNSPTVKVGYELLSKLPKENHDTPMLSLDKTKDPAALASWLGDHRGLLSWKLDGLTIVLTYEDGALAKAVTRGNGVTGEVITNNARVFTNIPLKISYKGRLVLRGEAVISYADFEIINENIGDAASQYKNPRNLCSGSVRQLDNKVTASRRVQFHAFTVVSCDGIDFNNSRAEQIKWLKSLGFDVVFSRTVTGSTVEAAVKTFSEEIKTNPIPSDGLVLTVDDIEYGRSLGATAKFPRDSIAFKWADDEQETTLVEVEWSASRTGLINPIAVFEPVELEGTRVSRASVHNVSIYESLKLANGDRIRVYKANMIIPQISKNMTCSGPMPVPEFCPVCGARTKLVVNDDVKLLYCTGEECTAKQIKSFDLFVSRDAMNIEGVSESTLEKWIAAGILHDFSDLFKLEEHRDKIIDMEGFGQKSYEKINSAAKAAAHTTFQKLIAALGINGIGPANGKALGRACGGDIDKLRAMTADELSEIDGIGPVLAASIEEYFKSEKNIALLKKLIPLLDIEKEAPVKPGELLFEGRTFVITGSLERYENRKALQDEIESLGGKVSGSVSAKTDYLINNDISSDSSKNRNAKKLGIPIITEEEYLLLAKGENR